MKLSQIPFALCLIFSASYSHAQVDGLGNLSYKLAYQRSILEVQLCFVEEKPLDKCIDDAIEKTKNKYNEFSKSIKSKQKKQHLKDHYIVLVSQIRGIEPENGERRISYDQRQADLKRRTLEAWTSFEVD